MPRRKLTDAERERNFRERYPFATYLGGAWQRAPWRPTQSGLYPIADRQGSFRGYRRFEFRAGAVVDATAPDGEPGWQGWIWSEPLPQPPKPVPGWIDIVREAPGDVPGPDE